MKRVEQFLMMVAFCLAAYIMIITAPMAETVGLFILVVMVIVFRCIQHGMPKH